MSGFLGNGIVEVRRVGGVGRFGRAFVFFRYVGIVITSALDIGANPDPLAVFVVTPVATDAKTTAWTGVVSLRFETVKIVAEVECADVMNLSGFVVFGFFAARRWRVDDSAGTLNNGVRSLAHQVLDSDVEAGGIDGDMVS